MDEYISRKAAIAYIHEQSEECQKAFEELGGEGVIYADAYNDLAEDFYSIPAADVAPVVHGRWIFTKRHLWYKDENGNIDEWRVDNGFHNGPECQICHTAFCEHCTPDWSTTECEIGHYYCSECAETSRDAHENYCPNCGAKMDGGEDR